MHNKQKLTKIEEEIWQTILAFYETYKVMPLRDEIASILTFKLDKKISPQLVQYWLRSMEKKGWIEIEPLKKRGIKLK